MTEREDNETIVPLLYMILCVMIFGAGAVLTGLVWVAVVGILFAVFLVALKSLPALLRYLAKLAVLPVFEPVRVWRSICERRASGERIGPIAAGFRIVWTFVASLFVWALFVGVLVGAYLDFASLSRQ